MMTSYPININSWCIMARHSLEHQSKTLGKSIMTVSSTFTLREFAQTKFPSKNILEINSVNSMFSPLVSEKLIDEEILTILIPFTKSDRLPYWHLSTVRDVLIFLNNHKSHVSSLLNKERLRLDHALQTLIRWSTEADNFYRIKADEPEGLSLIEDDVIPGYLRLVEAVYGPFTSFLCQLSTIKNESKEKHPDLIKREHWFGLNNLFSLTHGYDTILRNSIAHGSWRFIDKEIELIDFERKQKITANKLLEKAHDLRCTCTSIMIALIIHINQNFLNSKYMLPTVGQFILNSENSSLGNIERIHESGGDQNKLFIHVKSQHPYVENVYHLIIHLATKADILYGNLFERINISIDTGADHFASAFVSTELLRVCPAGLKEG